MNSETSFLDTLLTEIDTGKSIQDVCKSINDKTGKDISQEEIFKQLKTHFGTELNKLRQHATEKYQAIGIRSELAQVLERQSDKELIEVLSSKNLKVITVFILLLPIYLGAKGMQLSYYCLNNWILLLSGNYNSPHTLYKKDIVDLVDNYKNPALECLKILKFFKDNNKVNITGLQYDISRYISKLENSGQDLMKTRQKLDDNPNVNTTNLFERSDVKGYNKFMDDVKIIKSIIPLLDQLNMSSITL